MLMGENNQDYPVAQVESQPVRSDEIYAGVMQESRVTNVISQTSPDNQLMEIQMRIKGYARDSLTGQWEKIDPKAPEPNSLLVNRYISYLSSLLNENTRMTNLSPGEINAIMFLIIEWLTDDLDSNAETYALGYYHKKEIVHSNGKKEPINIFVNDYSERTRIGHILLNVTYMILKRSQNGLESKRIFSALNMTEALGSMGGGQKKGVLEALKFWK